MVLHLDGKPVPNDDHNYSKVVMQVSACLLCLYENWKEHGTIICLFIVVIDSQVLTIHHTGIHHDIYIPYLQLVCIYAFGVTLFVTLSLVVHAVCAIASSRNDTPSHANNYTQNSLCGVTIPIAHL